MSPEQMKNFADISHNSLDEIGELLDRVAFDAESVTLPDTSVKQGRFTVIPVEDYNAIIRKLASMSVGYDILSKVLGVEIARNAESQSN